MIVQRGLRGNCHSLRDWEKVFSPGEEEGELAAVWNRFVEAIWFIHGSKTPKQLLGAAHQFSQQFFDEEAWNPVVLPVFQMSLEVIREIAETLGENGSIKPFPLALSLMKNRIYVPQQKEGGCTCFRTELQQEPLSGTIGSYSVPREIRKYGMLRLNGYGKI